VSWMFSFLCLPEEGACKRYSARVEHEGSKPEFITRNKKDLNSHRADRYTYRTGVAAEGNQAWGCHEEITLEQGSSWRPLAGYMRSGSAKTSKIDEEKIIRLS